MTLSSEILTGVAELLAPKLSLTFTANQELTWLYQAIAEFGEEGWRYHDSKSGSNYTRFQVWLLHIEGRIRINYLTFIDAQFHEIKDEKAWYHKKIMELMDRIKSYDKNN